MTDFAAARRHMVDGQLLPNRVTEPRLIAAMTDIAREAFVPKPLQGVAYLDEDLEIAPGRYMMEPMILARLIQEAGVSASDQVLHIGGTTGYSTAVLGRLADVVVAVEETDEIVERATLHLADAEINNAAVIAAPLQEGYPAQAPYDVILIEGTVPDVPENLLDQLAEGGRLAAVLQVDGVGRAVLFVKQGGVVGRRELFDANTPPLPGFERQPGFVF
ncbi:MAG: protein-L-isoaspartate O-methyltransferase family protein [Alphaproteobacteria bacterium]